MMKLKNYSFDNTSYIDFTFNGITYNLKSLNGSLFNHGGTIEEYIQNDFTDKFLFVTYNYEKFTDFKIIVIDNKKELEKFLKSVCKYDNTLKKFRITKSYKKVEKAIKEL